MQAGVKHFNPLSKNCPLTANAPRHANLHGFILSCRVVVCLLHIRDLYANLCKKGRAKIEIKQKMGFRLKEIVSLFIQSIKTLIKAFKQALLPQIFLKTFPFLSHCLKISLCFYIFKVRV